jgi:hypothetical protein
MDAFAIAALEIAAALIIAIVLMAGWFASRKPPK